MTAAWPQSAAVRSGDAGCDSVAAAASFTGQAGDYQLGGAIVLLCDAAVQLWTIRPDVRLIHILHAQGIARVQ